MVLAHEEVAAGHGAGEEEAGGEEARRSLWVLHGVFGAGRNWGSVARRLVERRPEWEVLLVDLRLHGGSRGFPPPHTLDACASDLADLARRRGEPPASVLGHSFGGKVALAYLRHRPGGLRQVWVVDSTPSAGDPGGSAVAMLRAVEEMPATFAEREEAIAGLRRRGFDEPVARWMGTNLERADDGFRWRFDQEGVRALLEDFFATDLWEVVERPPPGTALRFLKATRSSILSEEECGRIEAIGARGGPVALRRVEGGHWLNADAPEEVVARLAEGLP